MAPSVGLGVFTMSDALCSEQLFWRSAQGTKLMTPEKARAIWAIYVWCRRTDELVDGPNASRMNPRVGRPSHLPIINGCLYRSLRHLAALPFSIYVQQFLFAVCTCGGFRVNYLETLARVKSTEELYSCAGNAFTLLNTQRSCCERVRLLEQDLVEVCLSCMQELDRWEERLEELFDGRPYDVYDAALTATISDFPVSIQPFRDMVQTLPTTLPVRIFDSKFLSFAITLKEASALCLQGSQSRERRASYEVIPVCRSMGCAWTW